MITFNNIPTNIRVPGAYLEVDNSNALKGLLPWLQKALLIGQMNSSGASATADTLYPVPSTEKGAELFGTGSMLARMIKAFKAVNPYIEVYAIGLAPGTPSYTGGTIAVAASSAKAGTINLMIGGQSVPVTVEAGDSATTIAANINTEIAKYPWLPITATVNSSTVTVLPRFLSPLGAGIDIRENYYPGQQTPSGVTLTITALSGGGSDPALTNAIAAMGDEQFDYVVSPFTQAASMTALETELSRRWGPTVQIPGGLWTAVKDSSVSNLQGWCSTNSRNSEFVSVLGFMDAPTPAEEIAAIYGAVAAWNLNIDPARPLQRLKLFGFLPPKVGSDGRFTWEERNTLLQKGIATFIVDSGGNPLIERAITNYQTNASGVPDVSYLDMNTLYTLMYIRYQYRARMLSVYDRYKLEDDTFDVKAGQKVARPKDVKTQTLAIVKDLADGGYVENFEQFKRGLIVERNGTDVNRVDVLLPTDLVNQFRVLAAQIAYIL